MSLLLFEFDDSMTTFLFADLDLYTTSGRIIPRETKQKQSDKYERNIDLK
jgi:hypothetical protein